MRALRAHEKPAVVGPQGRHDRPRGHAVRIISFTLCHVNPLTSAGTMNTAEQLRNRPWDAHEAASFLKVSRSWIYARVEREECRTFASAA